MTKVDEAHKAGYTGKGIKYCAIDSGVGDHEVIPEVITRSFAFDTAIDGLGHGTKVIGLIWMVLPDGTAHMCKELDDDGFGEFDNVAKAIHWAIDMGCTVINISIAGGEENPNVKKALKRADENRVIVCVSSGNYKKKNVSFPASEPTTIAVGACTRTGKIWWRQNKGEKLQFVAPGSGVVAPTIGNKWEKVEGTSFAVAIVSGICGQIQQKWIKEKGELPTREELIKELIKYSEDMKQKGRDIETGYGLARAPHTLDPHDPSYDPINDPTINRGEPHEWQELIKWALVLITIILLTIFTAGKLRGQSVVVDEYGTVIHIEAGYDFKVDTLRRPKFTLENPPTSAWFGNSYQSQIDDINKWIQEHENAPDKTWSDVPMFDPTVPQEFVSIDVILGIVKNLSGIIDKNKEWNLKKAQDVLEEGADHIIKTNERISKGELSEAEGDRIKEIQFKFMETVSKK